MRLGREEPACPSTAPLCEALAAELAEWELDVQRLDSRLLWSPRTAQLVVPKWSIKLVEEQATAQRERREEEERSEQVARGAVEADQDGCRLAVLTHAAAERFDAEQRQGRRAVGEQQDAELGELAAEERWWRRQALCAALERVTRLQRRHDAVCPPTFLATAAAGGDLAGGVPCVHPSASLSPQRAAQRTRCALEQGAEEQLLRGHRPEAEPGPRAAVLRAAPPPLPSPPPEAVAGDASPAAEAEAEAALRTLELRTAQTEERAPRIRIARDWERGLQDLGRCSVTEAADAERRAAERRAYEQATAPYYLQPQPEEKAEPDFSEAAALLLQQALGSPLRAADRAGLSASLQRMRRGGRGSPKRCASELGPAPMRQWALWEDHASWLPTKGAARSPPAPYAGSRAPLAPPAGPGAQTDRPRSAQPASRLYAQPACPPWGCAELGSGGGVPFPPQPPPLEQFQRPASARVPRPATSWG